MLNEHELKTKSCQSHDQSPDNFAMVEAHCDLLDLWHLLDTPARGTPRFLDPAISLNYHREVYCHYLTSLYYRVQIYYLAASRD